MMTQNPFQSETCKACWFDRLAPKFQISQQHEKMVVFKKPVLKGLVSFSELRLFASNLAWFQDFGKKELELLLSLKHNSSWDYFSLIYSEARSSLQHIDQLGANGFQPVKRPYSPMYLVDLSNGYDGYLAHKSSKYRYNVRQKLKNAEKQGVHLFTYDRFEDIEPFFEAFFAHHIPYWTQKIGASYYSDPHEREFSVAWAKQLYQTNQLRLHGLEIAGELVNLSVSIIQDDTLYWLLTINTGKHLDLFPGLVSLYLRLQEAGEMGIQTYNMGFGEYNYKNMVATHVENRQEIIVPNPRSLKGQLYATRARRQAIVTQIGHTIIVPLSSSIAPLSSLLMELDAEYLLAAV